MHLRSLPAWTPWPPWPSGPLGLLSVGIGNCPARGWHPCHEGQLCHQRCLGPYAVLIRQAPRPRSIAFLLGLLPQHLLGPLQGPLRDLGLPGALLDRLGRHGGPGELRRQELLCPRERRLLLFAFGYAEELRGRRLR